MPEVAAGRLARLSRHVLADLAAATAVEPEPVPEPAPSSRLEPPFLPRPSLDWRVPPPAHVVSPRELAPEEKARWQRDGYCVFKGFLSPAQLDLWRERVDAAVAERAGRRFPADPLPEAGPGTYYSGVFDQTLNLHQTNAGMREIVFETAKVVGRLAVQLNDHPLGFRLYVDQALTKQPWASPTGFHIDNPLWSFDSPCATTAWVALDHATRENGCLQFVRQGYFLDLSRCSSR